jgi:hypothetical protein
MNDDKPTHILHVVENSVNLINFEACIKINDQGSNCWLL